MSLKQGSVGPSTVDLKVNKYMFIHFWEGGGAEDLKQAPRGQQWPWCGAQSHESRDWPEPKSDTQPTEPPRHPGTVNSRKSCQTLCCQFFLSCSHFQSSKIFTSVISFHTAFSTASVKEIQWFFLSMYPSGPISSIWGTIFGNDKEEWSGSLRRSFLRNSN